MINVYSFQKMIQAQEGSEQKNISKTSQFVFGQNYKKLVANSKANFDFRKFLQKQSNTRKHFATLGTKESSKRNPLQDVSTSQFNQHTTLQSKAFKIRCYSRKLAKQNDKQHQTSNCKLTKYKPKIYPAKQQKSSKKIISNDIEQKKCIKLHKFDNYKELQLISTNIRIVYNDFISQSDKITDKTVIFDMPFFINCVKSSTIKTNQKEREIQHFRKKSIYLIKRIIEEKYSSFETQKNLGERPQIIFKVRKDEQIHELMRNLYQCEFGAFYCVFSVQNRHVESTVPYNLMRINNLAQNIIVFDSVQNLISYPPLVNNRHFIGFSTISQKSNIGLALQSFFNQIENLQIHFSAEDFEGQNQTVGQIQDVPYRQWLQKVKQRKNLKDCKKTSRQKKQRCHSSYENNCSYQHRYEQKTLQSFKEKMLKYLKIIGNENCLQTKRSKQFKISSEEELLQCFTSREKCSKTNIQIVSQLIRLNNHVHKQISSYQRKMEDFDINSIKEDYQNFDNNTRFQKIYINNLH